VELARHARAQLRLHDGSELGVSSIREVAFLGGSGRLLIGRFPAPVIREDLPVRTLYAGS
jgi:hypothetical protein